MFYGLCSKYGFGIYNDYDKAKQGKQWLSKSILKGFDSLYAAFEWATDLYNEFQAEDCRSDYDSAFFGSLQDIKINWIIYRKEIRGGQGYVR